MKATKRVVSCVLAFVIFISTISVSFIFANAVSTESETHPLAYYQVMDSEENTDGITMVNDGTGVYCISKGDEVIGGKVIYYSDMPLADITITASGTPTVKVSSDNVTYIDCELTDTFAETDGYHYFAVSMSAADRIKAVSYSYFGTRSEKQGKALSGTAIATEETVTNGFSYARARYGSGYTIGKITSSDTVGNLGYQAPGEAYFKLPAVMSDFAIDVTIPWYYKDNNSTNDVDETIHGTLGFEFHKFSVSVDGETWEQIPVAFTHIGNGGIGQDYCRKFTANGAVDITKGYKFLKVTFTPIDSTTHWISTALAWYQIGDLLYNYDPETMVETKYDYTVVPDKSDSSFKVISDYPYRLVQGDRIDSLNDVLSFNFTPEGWCEDVYPQPLNENYNKDDPAQLPFYNGTNFGGIFQFQSKDGGAITDIRFDGYDDYYNTASQDVEIKASSDGVNWWRVDANIDVHATGEGSNYQYLHDQSWVTTFTPDQNVQYLQFIIKSSTRYASVAAGLRKLSYNTDSADSPYGYNHIGPSEAVVTPNVSGKTLRKITSADIPNANGDDTVGSTAWNFTPSDWSWGDSRTLTDFGGTLVFSSKDGTPITNFRIVGNDYIYPIHRVTVSVSTDNENWSSQEITCTELKKATGNWVKNNNGQYEWSSTFDKSKGIKYIKFSISEATKWGFSAPGFVSLAYSTEETDNNKKQEDSEDEEQSSIVYANDLNLAAPSIITEGTVWDKVDNYIADKLDSRGYNLMIPKSDGSISKSHDNAEGEVMYRLSGVVTDLSIGIVGGTVAESDVNGYMKFYVSTDKVNWKELNATPQAVNGTDLGHWDTDAKLDLAGTCRYWRYDQTFTENDGYKYLKVVCTNGTMIDPVNRQLVNIRYNTVPTKLPYTYEFETVVTANPTELFELECDEGIALDSAKRLNPGWGNRHVYTFLQNVQGEKADKASGSVIFSSENGEPITEWKFTGVNSVWDYCMGEFKFYASTDKVKWDEITPMVEQGSSFFEAWQAFDFYYYGNFYPEDGYKYIKISATPPTKNFNLLPSFDNLAYSTEGYDGHTVVKPESFMNRSLIENYFLKKDNIYTFKSGTAMSHIDLHVIEPMSDTPSLTVKTGQGMNFLERAFRTLVKDNGDGTAEYSYYYFYSERQNITQLIIDLSEAEFVYLDYNLCSELEDTPRRHYTDVAIDESIKDLDMESKFTDFSKRESGNVVAQINAGLGKVNDPNMRGGEWSYGSHSMGPDFTITLSTSYVKDFKFRYAYHNDLSFERKEIRAYAGKDLEAMEQGEEVRIELVRQRVTQDDVEFNLDDIYMQNWYLRPADRSIFEKEDYKYIRIEVLGEQGLSDWSALCDFRYFYEMPEIKDLSAMEKIEDGTFEMLDNFPTPSILIDNGGKVYEQYNMAWSSGVISGFNASDNYIQQENWGSEAYIVYNYNGINRMDIRGYRSPNCIDSLVISVSADGVDWEEVETEYIEVAIYDGWYKFSYKADSTIIPEGTNFVKIAIPDIIENSYDLRISDVQLQYTNILLSQEDDFEEVLNSETSEENLNNETSEEVGGSNITQNKPIKKYRKIIYEGLEWWAWALIIGGSVLVVAVGTFLTIFLIKKKKKVKV